LNPFIDTLLAGGGAGGPRVNRAATSRRIDAGARRQPDESFATIETGKCWQRSGVRSGMHPGCVE